MLSNLPSTSTLPPCSLATKSPLSLVLELEPSPSPPLWNPKAIVPMPTEWAHSTGPFVTQFLVNVPDNCAGNQCLVLNKRIIKALIALQEVVKWLAPSSNKWKLSRAWETGVLSSLKFTFQWGDSRPLWETFLSYETCLAFKKIYSHYKGGRERIYKFSKRNALKGRQENLFLFSHQWPFFSDFWLLLTLKWTTAQFHVLHSCITIYSPTWGPCFPHRNILD